MNSQHSSFRSEPRGFQILIFLLLAVGFVARIAPFFDVDNRLLEQFVTEDGYFMLAIARNLAIGNGFSIADGEMPTNGTQPLTTLIFTLGFVLAGGAKKAGVAFAQAIQFIAAIAAAWFLFKLGLKALAGRRFAVRTAALASAIWFASPLTLPHSMNGLETGPYALVAVLVALRFVEREGETDRIWTIPQTLISGVLLGVAFWTRNDAAFLILAACLTYLYSGLPHGWGAVSNRFGRALIFGATSVIVASPWLGFNYRLFGHIVPVSGRAESLTAKFLHNVLEVPPVLLEYFGVFVPIPQVYEQIPAVAAACILPLLLIAALLPIVWRHAGRSERILIVLVLIYGSCLSAFYGLYFGAGWFMARYLFPLSPFLALLWAVGVYQWLLPRLPRPAIAVTAALTVAMVVAQNVRWYKGGDRHPHFQVIEWADENIPKAMWVGAIQTGTLGYFHNRTYNLDGKVNIDAFYATKNDRSGPYVITTDIEYLLDWTGMAEWLTKPAVEAEFRVLTLDYEKNLSVLQRRDRIRLGPDLGYDREAAKIALRQTASALEKLSTSDTQTQWQLLYQLAWLEDALEDEHEAERRSREALALCEETVKTEAWRRREILNRRQLATILRIHHRIDDAMAETQQAIALLQSSSTAASKQARRDLALSWLEQGELHWELGQYDEAEAKFKAALGELDRLAAEGATTVERDRAVALLSIGDAQLRRGDHAAATKSTQASLAIRKQRHARQPDRQATYDLALAQARLGRLAHLNGDPAGGAEQINASIALRRSLPRIDPGVAEPSPARTIEFNEGLLGTATLDLMVPVKPPTAETP